MSFCILLSATGGGIDPTSGRIDLHRRSCLNIRSSERISLKYRVFIAKKAIIDNKNH